MGAAMEWPRGEQYREVPSHRHGAQTREAQGVVAPSGVAFSLVTFFWRSKRKSLAVGQPPTS